MMRSLTKNLQHIVRQQQLFQEGEKVIVAVSGGADSMALLHLVVELAPTLRIQIHAATLDHGLRPGSADDVALVQKAAGTLGVPVIEGRVDVTELALSEGLGIELSARRARYAFLADVAQSVGATKVVTAHHAGDQAETVLMHLFRGSGTRGAAAMTYKSAMPYASGIELIRPLLAFSRKELRDYCNEKGIEFRDDPTNDDTYLLRNRLRHEVIPLLQDAVNPRVESALAQFAEISALEDDFLEQIVANFARTHVIYTGKRATISQDAFAGLHPALQRRLIRHVLVTRFPHVEPGYAHVLHAIRVVESGRVGALAEFPGGVCLRMTYNELVFEPFDAVADTAGQLLLPDGEPVVINIPGETHIPGADWTLHVAEGALENEAPHVLIAGIGKGERLVIRGRRPGDRFRPAGLAGHSQKLKDWMIDRKIPRELRDRVPLIVKEGIILAILWESVWFRAYDLTGNNTKSTFSLFFHKQLTM